MGLGRVLSASGITVTIFALSWVWVGAVCGAFPLSWASVDPPRTRREPPVIRMKADPASIQRAIQVLMVSSLKALL
jgi:hypothetical protein